MKIKERKKRVVPWLYSSLSSFAGTTESPEKEKRDPYFSFEIASGTTLSDFLFLVKQNVTNAHWSIVIIQLSWMTECFVPLLRIGGVRLIEWYQVTAQTEHYSFTWEWNTQRRYGSSHVKGMSWNVTKESELYCMMFNEWGIRREADTELGHITLVITVTGDSPLKTPKNFYSFVQLDIHLMQYARMSNTWRTSQSTQNENCRRCSDCLRNTATPHAFYFRMQDVLLNRRHLKTILCQSICLRHEVTHVSA